LQELDDIVEGMLSGNNSELHCGNVSLEHGFLWHSPTKCRNCTISKTAISFPTPPWYVSITSDNTELRFAK
jgi:hypothetical protein